MSELVNRQKLIEALEEVERRFPYKVAGKPDTYSEFNMAWESCMDCVFSAVDSQPPAERWIPCSERLPKKAHSYVVTEQTKDGRYIMSTRIFRGGKWVIEELYDDVKVIAWMPAEPYKGVE